MVKNYKFLMSSLFILLLTLFFTVSFASDKDKNTDAEKKSRFEYLELFNKVLYMIETQYYRDVDVKILIEGAIKGMMETLDPHSSFLGEEMFNKIQDDTNGEFGGLGIEVTQKDGVVFIISVLDDTPAFRSGLKAGDKIVEINHENTIGLNLDEILKKMKGDNKTKIQLGVVRDGVAGIKYFEIKREIIKLKPGKSQLLDEQFAFVRLSQFQKGSGEFIAKSLVELKNKAKSKNKELKGIILDLRSNPGGLLDEAVLVSSLFLKEGIIVATEGRGAERKDVRSVIQNGYKEIDLPLIVLINGSSASASEIVAGALQDHKRAIILGTQSFGKGSVQSVGQIDEKNGVKLTIAQYMTPLNRKIQALGIIPDIEVDEMDTRWLDDHRIEEGQLREVDLKNHLNATIETAEEKKLREDRQKLMREKRQKAYQERLKKKNGAPSYEVAEEEMILDYKPENDFQVVSALNYLKSFDVYKTFMKNPAQDLKKTKAK